MKILSALARKAAGITGNSLTWAPIWAAFFSGIVFFIRFIDPETVDPGEGPLDVAQIGFGVGLFSGAIYGVLLATFEHGKPLARLSFGRCVILGSLAGASWPLVSQVHDSNALLVAPIGALCAALALALARRAEGRSLTPPPGCIDGPGRLFGAILRAACTPEPRC